MMLSPVRTPLAAKSLTPAQNWRNFFSTLLDAMRKAQQPFVIVLGHPEYYPRFGFARASRYGIVSQYDNVPDEAFMILVLDRVALKGASGIAKYRAEFDAAM
jgi:putative acetyltransferase